MSVTTIITETADLISRLKESNRALSARVDSYLKMYTIAKTDDRVLAMEPKVVRHKWADYESSDSMSRWSGQ